MHLLCLISRRQNGESKPLTVPKDIDLHLEKAPVNTIDALGKTNTPLSLSQWHCSKYKRCSNSAIGSQCIYSIYISFKPLPQSNVWVVLLISRYSTKSLLSLLRFFVVVSTFSAAFLPGVPVADRFCSLCNRCLSLHWVLLQCCRCQQRGQHRSHLVCLDCSLQSVSFNCLCQNVC